MRDEMNLETLPLRDITKAQINACLTVVEGLFEDNLSGAYLYGSAVVGGLQRYSDIDLLIVCNRATTEEEKLKLTKSLLEISGLYMKEEKHPIELTIVDRHQVNPWRYPPLFDYQYGEWLRDDFEKGHMDIWPSKEMPDLALLITQVLLASVSLSGPPAGQILCRVPYVDFMKAITDDLPALVSDLEGDTRNVLLTLARIWTTVATDTIRSKPSAAEWVMKQLPEDYCPVMKRAKAICVGEEKEHWNDLQEQIQPCADYLFKQVNDLTKERMEQDLSDRSITLDPIEQPVEDK